MQQQGRRGGAGLLRRVREALSRAQPAAARARELFGVGIGVVGRWAWLASFAAWVVAYPLLRGSAHQRQLEAASRAAISAATASRNAAQLEARAGRLRHQ